MSDKIYAKGFYANAPRQNAPDYVKGSISIKVEDAINFLKENQNEKGYVNLDLLTSREEGKFSLLLNKYKPK